MNNFLRPSVGPLNYYLNVFAKYQKQSKYPVFKISIDPQTDSNLQKSGIILK